MSLATEQYHAVTLTSTNSATRVIATPDPPPGTAGEDPSESDAAEVQLPTSAKKKPKRRGPRRGGQHLFQAVRVDPENSDTASRSAAITATSVEELRRKIKLEFQLEVQRQWQRTLQGDERLKYQRAYLAVNHPEEFQKMEDSKTPESDQLMTKMRGIVRDHTLDEATHAEKSRALASTASVEGLTCVMLTIHTSGLLPDTGEAARPPSSPDMDSVTSIALLHPWSPILGTPRAFEVLSHHLTADNKGILAYLGKQRSADMVPEVMNRFNTRLSWAGRVHEALRRKDEVLRGSGPPSSAVSRP